MNFAIPAWVWDWLRVRYRCVVTLFPTRAFLQSSAYHLPAFFARACCGGGQEINCPATWARFSNLLVTLFSS